MARTSTKRGAAASPRGKRESRATSKKVAAVPVAEVEVVEEEKGLGVDDGVILMTTVLLVVAFFLADYLLGTDYGKGLFFGG